MNLESTHEQDSTPMTQQDWNKEALAWSKWVEENPKKVVVNRILSIAAGLGSAYFTQTKLMKKSKNELLKILATLFSYILGSSIVSMAGFAATKAALGFGRRRRSRSKGKGKGKGSRRRSRSRSRRRRSRSRRRRSRSRRRRSRRRSRRV